MPLRIFRVEFRDWMPMYVAALNVDGALTQVQTDAGEYMEAFGYEYKGVAGDVLHDAITSVVEVPDCYP